MKSHKAEKRWGKSHSAEKSKNGVPFCFGMVLYFRLEGLDVFKMKYLELLVKVHNAQKVDRSR